MTEPTIFEPLEAALFLGITPELLFSYTRNGPKNMERERNLKTVDREGRIVFRREDLEGFDAFLRTPWAGPDDPRPKIPQYVDAYLKVECGGQCPRCGTGFDLENAHIVDYAVSRSHHHHNLIRLCGSCHKEFDRKILTREQLVELKERLVSNIKTSIEGKLSYEVPHARAMPVPTRNFVGRREEVAVLGKALLNDRVMAIHGAGGCGKTELLVKTLAQHVDPREVIWIEVDSSVGSRAVEVSLRAALPSVGATGRPGLAAELDGFGGYVVFDGVESAEVDDETTFEDAIIDLIEGTEKVRFVLTSQVSFTDIPIDYQLRLRPLGGDASRAMLTANWLPTCSTDGPALTSLERFADGHPLTLRILNALLRHYEEAAIVARRVLEHGAPAVSHPVRKKSSNEASLERCLSTAFTLLDEDARRIMYLSSHLPSGFFEGLLDSEGLAIDDPESAVAMVRRWNLLDVIWKRGDSRRLRALSPIRAFFRHRYAQESPDLTQKLTFELVRLLAVQAVVIDHSYFSGGDLATGVERFGEELPNLLEASETARRSLTTMPEYLEWLHRISSSLQRYFFISGSTAQTVDILELGLNAAMQDENESKVCVFAMHLLIHAQRLDDDELRDKAMATLRDIAARTNEPELLAQRAIAESSVALERHDMEAARRWAETAVAQLRSCIQDTSSDEAKGHHRHLLSMALMALGRANEESRRFEPALSAFRESLAMMVEDSDFLNMGTSHHQIANCHAYMGDHSEATRHYLQAARLFSDGRISEHIGNSLSELGHLLVECGTDAEVDVVALELSSEVLRLGAKDVFSSMEWSCQHGPSMDNARAVFALRRLIGFCMLLSLVRRESALEEMCEHVRRELVVPSSRGFEPEAKGHSTLPADETVFLMALDVSIAVAGSLATMSPSRSARPSVESVFFVSEYCHMVELGTAGRFAMFDWFATYLRLRRGFPLLTGGRLRQAYISSNGDVDGFRLMGYESLLDTRT